MQSMLSAVCSTAVILLFITAGTRSAGPAYHTSYTRLSLPRVYSLMTREVTESKYRRHFAQPEHTVPAPTSISADPALFRSSSGDVQLDIENEEGHVFPTYEAPEPTYPVHITLPDTSVVTSLTAV